MTQQNADMMDKAMHNLALALSNDPSVSQETKNAATVMVDAYEESTADLDSEAAVWREASTVLAEDE